MLSLFIIREKGFYVNKIIKKLSQYRMERKIDWVQLVQLYRKSRFEFTILPVYLTNHHSHEYVCI